MPRPDYRHSVNWIRQHSGNVGATERVLSFIQAVNAFHTTSPHNGGPITVSLRLEPRNLYIASEMVPFQQGVQRLLRHEHGHVPAWEEAMRSSVNDLCVDLGSQIYGNVTPQAVDHIVRGMVPQWSLLLRQAADRWDMQDYPSLHQDLQTLGVPEI